VRPGTASARVERALLVVAVAAAIAAYLLAFLPGRGVAWIPALAVGFLLPAIWIQWTRLSARLVRPLSLAVPPLVATAALMILLSRQILLPVLREGVAHLVEFVVGGMLSVLAAVFLYGGRHWRVASGLLPVTVGILVAAGVNPRAGGFLPLAALAGTALWTHAFLSGGPRRLAPALGLFVMTGALLAAATIWFLPWAQPRVTQFVAQAYSEGQTGLSDRSELGEVQRLAPSRRVVARVWTERPRLLRMQVFNYFDGRRWSGGRTGQRVVTPLDAAGAARAPLSSPLREIPGKVFAVTMPRDGARLVGTKILPVLSFDQGWGLLLPARPMLLVWPGEKLTVDDLGRVTAEGSVARLYGVANAEGTGAGLEPTAADLAPPTQLDPRVRRLADDLRQGAGSNREIVGHTLDHLRSTYRYTLDVGRFQGRDPLAAFLFEKRAGYCEYFASAAVVLLRLQGVPARYVKGVAVRSESRIGDHYLVRESDAHAWVDLYIADEGWVEEDPTPANGYELTHPDPPPGFLADRWEALAARWSEVLARFQQGTWPRLTAFAARAVREAWDAVRTHGLLVAGVGAGVVSFAVSLRMLRRRRGPRATVAATSAAVPTDLRAALARVEKHWARCGRPRPPARGLREHLEAIPPGTLPAGAREISARVLESYYRASFGGQPPSSQELAELRRATKDL
jgi:transglutaminase-like putative cysteine protease